VDCGVTVEKVPWAEGKNSTCNAYRPFLARWARRVSWTEPPFKPKRKRQMPVIKIWCLPANQKEEELRKLHKDIVASVISIRELGLNNENDMTVLFPSDMMSYGLGSEIVIEVSGLLEKPERTQEVRQRLAQGLGEGTKALYPDAKIECFVQSFNPAQGFWVSEKT
jgi:hypothetical protein